MNTTMITRLSDRNPLEDLDAPVGIVAHDAGAANIIFEWLINWGGDYRLYLEGPAKRIWTKDLNQPYVDMKLEDVLSYSNTIFTGTGWASDIEFLAIQYGNQNQIPTLSVIDHWVNYSERFIRKGFKCLPNEIIVTDSHAFNLASKIFADTKISTYTNEYLLRILDRISPPPNNGSLLYVFEPVRSNWGKNILGEFQCFDYALKKIKHHFRDSITQIFLRPHPSDSFSKYSHYLDEQNQIKFDLNTSLEKSISDVDFVFGVQSYALYVAALASRKVYSTLPPWGPALNIPFPNINLLRDLTD